MIGKVNDGFFTKAILPHTGAAAAEVIVGPRMGVDAGIVRLGRVAVLKTAFLASQPHLKTSAGSLYILGPVLATWA